MIKKEEERIKAIALRKQGKTYSEILRVVPVAKSTLALWLHSVKLARKQRQTLTEAKIASSKRGGIAKRKQRIERQGAVISHATSEIGTLSKRELFLIGVALYWAEGSKEKEYKPGSGVHFSNMDPKMIQMFILWLDRICNISKDMLGFEIFLHESHKARVQEVKQHWAQVTGVPISRFSELYFKKNKLKKTNRKNVGEKYFGVLKMRVPKSSTLLRKLAGWAEGIYIESIK